MKRLARWLSNIFTCLSLLLFPTVLVLWYVSHHSYHVTWIRIQISQDGDYLRTDSFVCDRGRLSWSSQKGSTADSGPNRTFWKSYARSKHSVEWNYRFDIRAKTWPNISQRLGRVRILGFEFQYFGPLPDQQAVYDKSGLAIAAPCSGLTIVFGTVITVRLLRIFRRRRRRASNLCPNCGYDLRASPDRCPECGADVLPPSPNRH